MRRRALFLPAYLLRLYSIYLAMILALSSLVIGLGYWLMSILVHLRVHG